MDFSFFIFFGAVLIVGFLVFFMVVVSSRRKHSLDKMEYQSDFLAIENSLVKSRPETYSMVVMEGDKLLDKAMRELGFPGNTMGERLKKSGRNNFSEINQVWSAHKLRNNIAHEPRFYVDYSDAKRALMIYRKALKDLGAI